MSTWTTHLTNRELQFAHKLANRRMIGKHNGCHTGAKSQKKNVTYHRIGVCGEIAFAKMFGFEVDRNRYPNGDDGADFTTDEDMRIDVKCRSEPNKDLGLSGTSFDDFECHVLVLAWKTAPRSVRLVGWTTAARMLVAGRVGDWGPNNRKRYIPYQNVASMGVLHRMIG